MKIRPVHVEACARLQVTPRMDWNDSDPVTRYKTHTGADQLGVKNSVVPFAEAGRVWLDLQGYAEMDRVNETPPVPLTMDRWPTSYRVFGGHGGVVDRRQLRAPKRLAIRNNL